MHVFDFSFEEDNRSLEVAFEAYGVVKSVKKQTILSNQIIFDGPRLVDVALSGVLLRFLMVDICVVCGIVVKPLFANLCAVQGHRSTNCPNKDKCRKCGKTEHFARNCTFHGPAGDSADFPPLGSYSQSAEASVSRDSSDSQFLKDNELNLLQSQSILQDLVPVSGDSSEAESNQRGSKRVGEDKGSSAKRSNSAPNPTFNICFTHSHEFNSLVANSAELDGITSKGNNESATVRNISNERLNVINDNTSANSTERSNEVINNSSANSIERLNEVIDNSSTERSNEVNDITVNESNESSGGLNEVNAINPNIAVVENVAEMEYVDVIAGADAATSGRALIEVIYEGQADLSSDGTESFEDSSSSLSLTPIFSDPPSDFADAMDERDSPPGYVLSSFTSPPSGQVGSRYEERSLCAKAKSSRGTASVRQSPLLNSQASVW